MISGEAALNQVATTNLKALAVGVVQRLQQAGFEAYWVGGCVRDFLLGREPDDYDVVTLRIAGTD
jgi:tRNA nucleotidyltransferase/poly(A) polymerase